MVSSSIVPTVATAPDSLPLFVCSASTASAAAQLWMNVASRGMPFAVVVVAVLASSWQLAERADATSRMHATSL